MLAEIFMLRLETMLRTANEQGLVRSSAPFVPNKLSDDARSTGR
jgi:hypothetical protein